MFILKEWKNEIEKSYILKKDFDGLQWKTYALNEFRPFNFQTQAQAGPTRCQVHGYPNTSSHLITKKENLNKQFKMKAT